MNVQILNKVDYLKQTKKRERHNAGLTGNIKSYTDVSYLMIQTIETLINYLSFQTPMISNFNNFTVLTGKLAEDNKRKFTFNFKRSYS